jgi:ElaB/YqjD/DUF883 family membrane-anchored ribosome-binding protein
MNQLEWLIVPDKQPLQPRFSRILHLRKDRYHIDIADQYVRNLPMISETITRVIGLFLFTLKKSTLFR